MESLISFDCPVVDSDCESELIFECPGLAPTGEMVVTNPFFMQEVEGVGDTTPCPVNSRGSSIRHSGFTRTDRLTDRQTDRQNNYNLTDRQTHRQMVQAH